MEPERGLPVQVARIRAGPTMHTLRAAWPACGDEVPSLESCHDRNGDDRSTIAGLGEILAGPRSYFPVPVAYTNDRVPIIPSEIRARPLSLTAGVGDVTAAVCDPFWTEKNEGICSDQFGHYLKSPGVPVKGKELSAAIDRWLVEMGLLKPQRYSDQPANGNVPGGDHNSSDFAEWLSGRSTWVWIGAAFFAIALIAKRK